MVFVNQANEVNAQLDHAASLDESAGSPSATTVNGKINAKENKVKNKATAISTQLGQFIVDDDSTVEEERKLHALSTALEKLSSDLFDSEDEREVTAGRVNNLFGHYCILVRNVVTTESLSSSSAMQREFRDAARAMIILDDFHRHHRPEGVVRANMGLRRALLFDLVTPAGDNRFVAFFSLMVSVTSMLRSCGMATLEAEIIMRMERNLLSIQSRSCKFREMVSWYQGVTALTPEAKRQLEWFMSDHGISNTGAFNRPDRLARCHHFLRVRVRSGFDSDAFRLCRSLLDETIPIGRSAVCTSDTIIAGAEKIEDIHDILKAIKDAARVTDLQHDTIELDLTSAELYGFEFSAAGAVRKTLSIE